MSEDALLKRLDRIESTLAIQQLPCRYARALDAKDSETWANLFVEDVRVTKDKSGRAALKAFIENGMAKYYRSTHFVCGQVIDFVDDDHATGTVYCRDEYEDRGKWIVMAICYFDRYERHDGAWYFRRRNEQHWYSVDILERPSDSTEFQRWDGHPQVVTLPAGFPTWNEFWAKQDASLIAELTNAPV